MHGVAACAPDPLPEQPGFGSHFAPPPRLEERQANAQLLGAMQAFVVLARITLLPGASRLDLVTAATEALRQAGLS